MYEIGVRLKAFGKSMHAGQSGILVKDYGSMLVLKADDPKYSNAYKSAGKEGKYFQVDALLVRQIKES